MTNNKSFEPSISEMKKFIANDTLRALSIEKVYVDDFSATYEYHLTNNKSTVVTYSRHQILRSMRLNGETIAQWTAKR